MVCRNRHWAFPWMLLVLLSSQAVATEGTFIHGHGPIQGSLTGAGVASPRDASWMILNPAGIVSLERRIDIGLDTVLSDVTLNPDGILGNRFTGEMTDSQFFFIPSVGAVWPMDKGAVGLGVYVPSGIGDDFPHSRNIISRIFDGNGDRRLVYQHVRLVLAYGRKFQNGWAAGIAVNGSLSRLRTDSLTLGLTCTQGDNEWDDALGSGFTLGAYRKWEKWAFGASYQSRQWSQRFDEYDDLLRWSLDLPEVVQLGVAYNITPSFKLVGDYKFIHWTSVKMAGEQTLDGGFGWNDQHIFKLGFEWGVANKWVVRGGFSTGNPPVDEEHLFINGLTSAGIPKQHVGLGVSYAVNDRSNLHVTYVRALENSLTASRHGDLLSLLTAGTEAGLSHDGIAIGYTYKF